MGKNTVVELSGFLPRIKVDVTRTPRLTGGFLVLMIIIKVFLEIPIPNAVLLIVFIMFSFNVLNYFLFIKLKEEKIKRLTNYYFGFKLSEAVWLTMIIYFTGGITWIAPLFYSFLIVNAFWIFSKNKAILLIGCCNLLLISLVLLQYFKIVPDFYIFLPETKNFQNLFYVLLTTFGALAFLGYLGYSSNIFYQLLQTKIVDLKKTKEILEKTKRLLETEAQKRTKELIQEKKRLEIEAKERTKKLEERRRVIQEKVKELEKSHKIAIDRELKMAELKEKLKRFGKAT